MATPSSSTAIKVPTTFTALGYPEIIADGDTVVISGGGLNKCITVKAKSSMKLGRCGNVHTSSLIGHRYGDVFAFDDKKKILVPTLDTPELDRSEVNSEQVAEENKDNRELFDLKGANQSLTQSHIHQIREEMGVETVVKSLVENSSTFESKTAFAQEKYVRKKKAKYIVKFKIERVNPDNLCETIVPTLLVAADEEDDSKKRLPLRVDTMGLILHHANVSGSMRIMLHDRTNGLLPAGILYRLGQEGRILGVYDRTAMPATTFARAMHIPNWKARWKAIPASPAFFTGVEQPTDDADAKVEAVDGPNPAEVSGETEGTTGKAHYYGASPTRGPSQWLRGHVAHKQLVEQPADSLIIAGFEDEIVPVVKKLFPFLALSGNLVIYCPFIEPLERVYSLIRDEAVCISISDTWYRHQQVLPGRTHPQVNMSTSGGFILTAIKVEHSNGNEAFGRVGALPTSPASPTSITVGAILVGEKREREEAEQPTRAEAEKESA